GTARSPRSISGCLAGRKIHHIFLARSRITSAWTRLPWRLTRSSRVVRARRRRRSPRCCPAFTVRAAFSPASSCAGFVPSPAGARLEPGEVLVAPATDPGWTPLFLTASALVMEMGGMMSHGAVVAREYGIPAVVGVPDATTRIATGERIVVDGSAGTVAPEGREEH